MCLALSLLYSFYNITPLFSLLYWKGFSPVHELHLCNQKKKRSGERINKNVLAVTRDLSPGNEGPGEEDKGGKTHAVV